MIDVAKLTSKAGIHLFVVNLRSSLSKQISTIKAVLLVVLALILILAVRAITLFMGGAEAPEIDLQDLETR